MVGVAVVFALAGCGGSSEVSGSDTGPATALTINLDVDGPGGKPAEGKTIECGQGSSDGATDCGLLRLVPAVPPPTPADEACTEIFGGPEVLTLSGTLRNKQVDAKLTRANGCEIARFDPFVPVLHKLFPDYEPGGAIAGRVQSPSPTSVPPVIGGSWP